MRKALVLYVVMLSALAAFAIEVVTGFVLWFAIGHGDGRYTGGRLGERPGQEEFLGISRGTWVDIHDWAGVVLLAAIAVHLILHWRWVISMTKQVLAPWSKRRREPPEIAATG